MTIQILVDEEEFKALKEKNQRLREALEEIKNIRSTINIDNGEVMISTAIEIALEALAITATDMGEK